MTIRCNAVFKGGGAKGIAYAGALRACEEWDIEFEEVAGSSAGAITAALVACDYTATELLALMPEALKTIGGVGSAMAMVGRRASLLSSDSLRDWLQRAIADKIAPGYTGEPPDCTFEQIRAATGISLYVITLDLASRQPLVFCPRLTPDSGVAAAVAASSAIPVAFPPARMVVDGEVHRLVDGGTWSNYPSFVFLDDDFRHCTGLESSDRPTIGFVLDLEGVEPTAPSTSPHPMPGSPLISDRGSSADELGLGGAVLSSTIFRWAIGLTPILFVLLSISWIAKEVRGNNPLIGHVPTQLQDLALAASVALLAFTGIAAGLMAFVILRLGKSLFDTGVVGASAAMGVGPSVPYWVGTRSQLPGLSESENPGDQDLPEHVAVRIKVPLALKTLAFGASPELRRAACVRGWDNTSAELVRVFGPPPGNAAPSYLDAIGAETTDDVPEPRSALRRIIGAPLDLIGWIARVIGSLAGRLLGWTSRIAVLRAIALLYVLIVGSGAALKVAIGFADGATLRTAFWAAVVGSTVVVAVWLIATMRHIEVINDQPYRILRRLKYPVLLRILSVLAAVLALGTAAAESEYDVSFFTAISAEELVGEVSGICLLIDDDCVDLDSTDPGDDPLYGVFVTVDPDDQKSDDSFSTYLDIVDPLEVEATPEFVDLSGADVIYEGDDEVLVFGFPSHNLRTIGDSAIVKVDLDDSLAFLKADLSSDLGAEVELQAVLTVALALLTFSFRSMRAANWMSQQRIAASA
ncbi:patatin-like phospholipase family protein [Ilumatobacter sp.]|uniref:patatin-like phospholipase family protein n=1 Tax=Ilumatobacter sp. TaxID=1967498 RepID=UPI003C4B64F5